MFGSKRKQMETEQNEKVGSIWSLLTSTSAGTILDDQKFFKPNTFYTSELFTTFYDCCQFDRTSCLQVGPVQVSWWSNRKHEVIKL